MTDVIIYHNPACETSRNTLAMIRNAGVEPHVIEYLKCPPTRLLLTQLLDRAHGPDGAPGVAREGYALRRARPRRSIAFRRARCSTR